MRYFFFFAGELSDLPEVAGFDSAGFSSDFADAPSPDFSLDADAELFDA